MDYKYNLKKAQIMCMRLLYAHYDLLNVYKAIMVYLLLIIFNIRT